MIWCQGDSRKCWESPQLTPQLNTSLPHCTFLFSERVSWWSPGQKGFHLQTPARAHLCLRARVKNAFFLLEFRFPNTEQYTKPTGLFPLYMPGHHRRNYFSCFLVPGAGHSISALIPPKPSHVLSSGTPVEDLVGLAMGHTAPLSRRPSFFPPPLRPLLSWAAAQHQHRLPTPAPQQLVCYPLRRCQVSGWSLGKRSPWAAESAVGAQDSVTWYEQPTLKSRADNPVPHVCQL